MQPKKTIVLITFVCSAIVSFARSLPPIAAVKSSTIPAEVFAGSPLTVWCEMSNRTQFIAPLGNYCWDNVVYSPMTITITAINVKTGVSVTGQGGVPGPECVAQAGESYPLCTIQLGSPIFPPKASD